MFNQKQRRVEELEAEADELRDGLQRTKEALALKTQEFDAVEARLFRERQMKHPQRGLDLAREAIDLIRFSEMFPQTDPAVPRYSHSEVEAGWRRIHAELEA